MSSVRRFRVGVVTWNGLISVSWIALAVGRTIQFRSPRYVVVILLGLAFAASTARLLWPVRSRAAPALLQRQEVRGPELVSFAKECSSWLPSPRQNSSSS